jgi:glycosyltransferase involved in cell wall biosynthesis
MSVSSERIIRLAILSSHPVQYNAPLFLLLSQREDLQVRVFYSWEGTVSQIDPEFGEKITWDIPLLEGYEYFFIPNVSNDPGSHHFRGLDNPSMIEEIEHWGPDTLLVYGWAFKTHLKALRHFHGKIPIFFRGDSTLLSDGNPVRKILRRLWLRWVYKYVDVVFYPGQRSREYFLAHGMAEDQLVHVPHSIDNRRFQINADELEKEALQQRRQLGIPDDAMVVLFAGKLVSRKQPEYLLRIVLELVTMNQSTPLHLVFAGTGPLLKCLKEKAGSSPHIHFIGFKNQSEMPLTYRIGNIFILPSVVETWGLAVNEAMACGRAVVVSDRVGCTPDLIKRGINGDIFSCGSERELKNILLNYLKNPNELVMMGKNAQKMIEDWSTEVAAKKIVGSLALKLHAKF